MTQFIVSARKYRPQTFEDVVGQKHITDTLINEIESGHLAQAFLFTGPRGVGKTTCARILAKVLNTTDDSKENQDFAFNIFELDAASNNSVDDIRSLNEQVRIPPQTGKYKVYIIDEVHMLSASAFNAFLKTLEEPPSYAIFILATTEKHKILPTILSRCQIFNFNRITVKDIVVYLEQIASKEGVNVDKEALHLIAQKADGAMRDALSMFDQLVSFSQGNITYEKTVANLNLLDTDNYFKIVDALLAQNISEALLVLDEVLRKGFDGHQFLIGLNDHLRNLLMVKDTQTHQLIEVSESIQDRLKEQSEVAPYSTLLNALNIAHQFEYNYKSSNNKRLHIELCLMKINALPYLMKGHMVEQEGNKVMEFKNVIAYPVDETKHFAPIKKTNSTKTVFKIVQDRQNKPKLADRIIVKKSHKEPVMLKDEELQKLPSLKARVVDEYQSHPKEQNLTVAEPENSLEKERNNDDVQNFKEFTLENIKQALDELSMELNEVNKKAAASLVKDSDFAIQGNSLLYNFGSTIEQKQFKSCIVEINKKLRKTFGEDYAIETRVTITETEAKKIYSESQKFANMIAESKGVKKLVDALGLKIKK